MPNNRESANAVPSLLKSRVRAAADRLVRNSMRLENALYECGLGITTHGLYNWSPGDWSRSEHLFYYATPYRRVFRILESLHLGPSDRFVDLGCGKGRVICCASRYCLAEVIGIEDVADLCTIAKENLRCMRGRRAATRIFHGKAEDFEYTECTVVYMFHPFGPQTLASVLARLYESLRLNPRSLKIVYVNPVHERVLKETNWLKLYDYWPSPRYLLNKVVHPVSFWRARMVEPQGEGTQSA